MRKLCTLTLLLSLCYAQTYVCSEENATDNFISSLDNQQALPSFDSEKGTPTCSVDSAETTLPCGCDARLKVGRVEFGAAFGKYIGIRHGYTELGLFEMIETRSGLNVFFEGRGFLLSNHDWAGSLGLGVRKSVGTCSPVIIGANIYYDYRDERFSKEENCDCCVLKSKRKSFGSIGLGVEAFTEYLDFRANAYLPVKETQGTHSDFFYPDGGFFARFHTFRSIPYGVDAEVSKRLNFCSQFYAVGAVGGYGYFFRHHEDIYGPFARLELGWGDYLSLQARYSYDQHFHSSVQGKVLFSIPFEQFARCFDACSAVCFDPLTQPVRRNYIPFTQKKCCWKWNW